MPVPPSTNRSLATSEGSIDRVARAKGPDVWVYRWRGHTDDGNRVQRKQVIGTLAQFPTVSDAKREVENLRAIIHGQHDRPGKMTVS